MDVNKPLEYWITKIICDIGCSIALGAGYLHYVFAVYSTSFIDFLKVAGPLFAALATLCGLTLGYASIYDEHNERKRFLIRSSERLLHATFLFTMGSIIAMLSIGLDSSSFNTLNPNVGAKLNLILLFLGTILISMSFWFAYQGAAWLSHHLWDMWALRTKDGWGLPSIDAISPSSHTESTSTIENQLPPTEPTEKE